MFFSDKARALTNPRLFSAFINLRSFIKKSPFRCSYDSKLAIYKLRFGQEIRFASVNSRVLIYLEGFFERANYIGNTYMLNLVKFNDGDLVVDCGANMGDLHLFLQRTHPKVNYIAFEANPNDFKCLVRNVGSENCQNIGLWNENGSIPFYVNDAHASSSFIQPPEFTDIIEIPAATLGSLFPNEPIRLLKLEAEGAEPEVLQGSAPILHLVDYISADVGPERGVHEEETRDYVVNFLEAAGFELVKENKGHRKIVLFRRMNLEEH